MCHEQYWKGIDLFGKRGSRSLKCHNWNGEVLVLRQLLIFHLRAWFLCKSLVSSCIDCGMLFECKWLVDNTWGFPKAFAEDDTVYCSFCRWFDTCSLTQHSRKQPAVMWTNFTKHRRSPLCSTSFLQLCIHSDPSHFQYSVPTLMIFTKHNGVMQFEDAPFSLLCVSGHWLLYLVGSE